MGKEIPQVAAGTAKPGGEIQALKPFHRNCTWTGTVKAGAMGPGSPEMQATGHAAFRWVMDGLWVVGEFEQDQFVNGRRAVTWKAHYVAGWDRSAGEYRALVADSNGAITVMKGEVKGSSFVLTSLPDPAGREQPMRLRMTWTPGAGKVLNWRNEGAVNGGPWFLIEEYTCTITE
jgi:hypothetical protein